MYCRNCGSTISEHSTECKKCGAAINKQADQCVTCKHRTFSRFGRLLCNLTNQRPTLNGEICPNYSSDCPICKDSTLDLASGVVCASTKEKYTCNESCPKYNAWREEANLHNNRLRNAAKEKRITSWLLAFVILTAIDVLYDIISLFYEAPYTFVAIIQIIIYLPVFIAGISCIVALYKRASNAVSLSITYCVMGILSCIWGIGSLIYISYQLPNQAPLSAAVLDILVLSASLIWWIVWIVYFIMSYKVDVVLPREKRKWSWFEIILLSLWVLELIIGAFLMIIGTHTAQAFI